MSQLQISKEYDAGADFISESWEVMPTYPGRPLQQGSLQLIWESLNSLTAEADVQVSNNNIDWNCYGGSLPVTLTPASDNQLWSWPNGFTERYVRVRYTANAVTSGKIKIWTHGVTV